MGRLVALLRLSEIHASLLFYIKNHFEFTNAKRVNPATLSRPGGNSVKWDENFPYERKFAEPTATRSTGTNLLQVAFWFAEMHVL